MQNRIQKLKGLEEHLKASIKGQEHAIKRVLEVIEPAELGLIAQEQPKGSFLFVGSTGTGKTELVRCFTDYLFGLSKLLRIDMSEYSNEESLGRLIGYSEGETGLLGAYLDSVSEGTLLFDEMEKAHPKILDLFLQMLDAGRITLADKKTRDLTNFYVVFTSNIGSRNLQKLEYAPFSTTERIIQDALSRALRPEFLGRIDEIVVFKCLSYETQREICRLMAEKEIESFRNLGMDIHISPTALNFLHYSGFSRHFGARNMRKQIRKELRNALSKGIKKAKTFNFSGKFILSEDRSKILLVSKDTKEPNFKETLSVLELLRGN